MNDSQSEIGFVIVRIGGQRQIEMFQGFNDLLLVEQYHGARKVPFRIVGVFCGTSLTEKMTFPRNSFSVTIADTPVVLESDRLSPKWAAISERDWGGCGFAVVLLS